MYIEDNELRDIYKTVTPERLQNLEDALIHLEKQPDDQAKIEEFLREAHTLKGDSRMLGVKDVETLTHEIEDCLIAIKKGKSVLTPDLCDRIHAGLDATRKLVHEAVTGEPADVVVFQVLANLMGAQSDDNGNGNGHSASDAFIAQETDLFNDDWLLTETPSSSEPVAVSPQPVAVKEKQDPVTPQQPVRLATDTLETIRVEAAKLDTLIRQVGELGVTKLRIAERMTGIESIVNLWEEWSRDVSVNRSLFRQESLNGHSPQLQKFYNHAEQRLEELGTIISQLKNAAYEDNASLDIVSNELEAGVKNLRLLPLSTIFTVFPRMVRDLAKEQGKQINLVIEGGETLADKRVLEEMKDPLMHILRNAVDHGIEIPQEREIKGKSPTATIRLCGYQTGSMIAIDITDDGRGLNLETIKRTAIRRGIFSEEELEKMTSPEIQSLIFASGFSTRAEVSEISGRGVGLDVVRANVERLKGSIQVESTPGMGCEFRLQLSTSLATSQVLIVEVNETPYAMPLEAVETMLLISRDDIFALEGTEAITFGGEPVSITWLVDLLELPVTVPTSAKAIHTSAKTLSCIILKFGTNRLGIIVDDILDQQDIVLKPQSKLLKRIRNINGATILGDGQVCMVLNPEDLLKSVQGGGGATVSQQTQQKQTKSKLLLVEDSIIIRTQMKRLLEEAGYDVTIAVDGLEGFNKLRAGRFDAVVSDVEMPNLSGLDLTAKIRQYGEYNELPIILVTTLTSEADKRRGAQAGANAYLTKGDFDQKILIETLRRFI